MREAAAENTVVIVGDVDMLTDGAAVDIQEIFGQRVAVPRNGNLAFAQGLVEQMAGDSALINLRSRAAFSRPLTVIKQMEAQAQETYLGKIKELEDTLNQTTEEAAGAAEAPRRSEGQRVRRALARTAGRAGQLPQEIDGRPRQELKELRKNLREETESLQFWTKVINIGAMPLLVMLLGAGLAIALSRKQQVRP